MFNIKLLLIIVTRIQQYPEKFTIKIINFTPGRIIAHANIRYHDADGFNVLYHTHTLAHVRMYGVNYITYKTLIISKH